MKRLKRQVWSVNHGGPGDNCGNMFSLTAAEETLAVIEGSALICAAAYFFYCSFAALPFLFPLLIPWMKYKRRVTKDNKKERFRVQFRDAVMSVSTNQRAGYSVENAFREAYKDMKMLYGENSMICSELKKIAIGLGNHLTLEELTGALGERCDIDDVRQFAEIFRIARKSGGNMPQIIGYTAEMIDGRTEVEKDIHLMLTSRRYEQKLMEGIPFFLITYMKITNKGFFDVLYHNTSGIMIMTACLGLYLAACAMSERIIRIVI